MNHKKKQTSKHKQIKSNSQKTTQTINKKHQFFSLTNINLGIEYLIFWQ